jgi:hypothetical protein
MPSIKNYRSIITQFFLGGLSPLYGAEQKIFNHSTADIRYVFHQFIVFKKQPLKLTID